MLQLAACCALAAVPSARPDGIAWLRSRPHVPAIACRSTLPHALADAQPDAQPDRPLRAAYLASGAASALAWSTTSAWALGTYKPHRIAHNTVGVLQALTVIPLICSTFGSLASAAAHSGRAALRHVIFRRLNLGCAAASLWSAFAVVYSPQLTAALVRTVDPVVYPGLVAAGALGAYLSAAALCLDSWSRSVDEPRMLVERALHEPRRLVERVLRSLSTLAPHSNPTAVTLTAEATRNSMRNHYSLLTFAFGLFSALAIFAPFPLATVPSLVGKRLARAFGAWTLLASIVCYTLRSIAHEEPPPPGRAPPPGSVTRSTGGDGDAESAAGAPPHVRHPPGGRGTPRILRQGCAVSGGDGLSPGGDRIVDRLHRRFYGRPPHSMNQCTR